MAKKRIPLNFGKSLTKKIKTSPANLSLRGPSFQTKTPIGTVYGGLKKTAKGAKPYWGYKPPKLSKKSSSKKIPQSWGELFKKSTLNKKPSSPGKMIKNPRSMGEIFQAQFIAPKLKKGKWPTYKPNNNSNKINW